MGDTVTYAAFMIAMPMLAAAFAILVYRIFIGPTLPDRVLCLDTLVVVGIGFISAIALKTRVYQYLDVAIALGLVGFLATVAFARYIGGLGPALREPTDPKRGGSKP